MTLYEEPFHWWGWHWYPSVPLSIVQLIEARSLDSRLAALLWMFMERKASIIVAAEPPSAGKTTTLTALVDLLPVKTKLVFTQGLYEDFGFAHLYPADGCYLLCNEISPDLPVYMWGRKVADLFSLLREGYALGTTMHASTAQGVLRMLAGPPNFVPSEHLAQIQLIVCLKLVGLNGAVARRVSAVDFVVPSGDGYSLFPLARWNRAADRVEHLWQDALDPVTRWLALDAAQLVDGLEARRDFLEQLRRDQVRSPGMVREAVARFRGEIDAASPWPSLPGRRWHEEF
jgi:hypothetical protein